MHIHIIAVAGTGMGALAGLLRELGHEVSGSDTTFYPPMGPALERWGVRCFEGFRPENLEPRPDLVVVGNVCRRDNPEVAAARSAGIEVTHIAGALQRFVLEGTTPLVIAGTHGKTTTTAMTSWLLDHARLAPGFLVGGLPKGFEHSFRACRTPSLPLVGERRSSRRPPFVIEGDEYDTAFFEKTPKFVHYGAQVAIITSIEHDHIDIYPEPEAYYDAFRTFLSRMPVHGLVVAYAGDAQVVRIVQQAARSSVVWYALCDEPTFGVAAQWQAAPGPWSGAGQAFDLFVGGMSCGRFTLSQPGGHNLRNALGALAATTAGFDLPLGVVASALATFPGVRRRQDLLGEPRGVRVYDDFAHHPTAVRETLAALRQRHPEGRLFAVFEPRTATACRKLHQEEYARCFASADSVLLAPLGRSGLPESERLDVSQVIRELKQQGQNAECFTSVDAIVRELEKQAEPGDTIALLSNGAFDGIYDKLLTALGGT